MAKTLVVTNDYPPRHGGIQSFVEAMVSRMPADEVIVYASTWRGRAAECARYDAAQPHPVIRERTSVLLPTPARTRRARDIARAEGCEAVWFGAAAPLGLMGGALRRAGVSRLVATTHGHEAGWAMLPVARQQLRRIGERVDVVTYLAEYFRLRVSAALRPAAAERMTRLSPGVDTDVFRPDLPGTVELRARLGLADSPVIVCVSRLVARKGQDTLIRALPLVRRAVPGATLLIVGDGPYAARLRVMADASGSARHCAPPRPNA
jgi:phosphatidylinositol alpha-1,6-mannosyltransferase